MQKRQDGQNALHGDMKSESCDYVRVLNAELQYVSIEVTRSTRFDISRFNEQLNEVIRDAQSNHLFVTFRLRHLLLASLPPPKGSSYCSIPLIKTRDWRGVKSKMQNKAAPASSFQSSELP